MSDTMNLTLPLLAASQAQKHVTVNEALARLDGVVQMRLRSRSLTTPPDTVIEGECFGVPSGAVNGWDGHAGEIAQYVNGGWAFFAPQRGWRAFVADTGTQDLFDGAAWRTGGLSLTPGGGGLHAVSAEADVTLTAGATVPAGLRVPARCIVLGVTGRVIETITGTLADWRLGDVASDARFGAGLGLAQNSWISGPTTPFVVWSDTELMLSATGGDFAGGAVRLVVHYLQFAIPDAV
ncbi:DUF2793 domain-containing protein [Nioella nitratireducens]|uniref:DUF2793 domain-containing protein n=1 Tax=Nioella nitratireducens TaxID=1287720 RepID=UPI0008FD70A8|nr:DUF2793 domain-containing protein [Nioella nitratireducens]